MNLTTKRKKLIAASVSAVFVLIILGVYYSGVLKKYYIKNAYSHHTVCAEKGDARTQLQMIMAANILEDSNIIQSIMTNSSYKRENVNEAIYVTNIIAKCIDAESVSLGILPEKKFFINFSMIGKTDEEFKTMYPGEHGAFMKYMASPENNLFLYDNKIYYVYTDYRNITVMYKFKPDTLKKSLIAENDFFEDKTAILNKNEYLCGDDKDISEKITKRLISNEKNTGYFFSGANLYIFSKKSSMTFLTRLTGIDLLEIVVKNSGTIILIFIVIILLGYAILLWVRNYLKKKMRLDNNRHILDKIEFVMIKLFTGMTLSGVEMKTVTTRFEGTVTPILVFVDFGSNSTEMSKREKWSLVYGVCNIIDEIFGKFTDKCESQSVAYKQDIVVCILEDKSRTEIMRMTEKVIEVMQEYFGADIYFVIGKTYKRIEKLTAQLNAQINFIDYSFLCGKERVLFVPETYDEEKWYQEADRLRDGLLAACSANDNEQIRQSLDTIRCSVSEYMPTDVKNWIITLLSDIYLLNKNTQKWNAYEKFNKLTSCHTIYEMIDFIEETVCIEQEVEPNKDIFFKVAAEKDVFENYTSMDYSLQQLADTLCLNKKYAGHKFGEVFGVSFTQYVTELRIDKACDMLKNSNRKIGDIAVLCGFSSSSYFVKIFKKNMGLTPQEYRNKE